MIKMMMAAAGLSIGLLMMPVATAPAKADVNIDINLGGKKYISCSRGRRIVEDYGYWDVRARDCNGSTYSYFGRRKKNNAYIITLDSRRGYIIGTRRIYY